MSTFFILIPILLYVGIIAAFVYVLYHIVDRWVDKSLTVRREQNALLAKLIDNLEDRSSKSGDDPASTL
ncbi:hypothetical protein [Parapedobacter sp.]